MQLSREFSIFTALLMIVVKDGDCLVDPITFGVGATVGLGVYGFSFIKKNTYCRMSECCDERSIPGNVKELKKRLKANLFGQHIVLQQLIPALEAHFSPNSNSRKPLVISFHGTPGTGKNFVADIIAESLFAEGLKSRYVHKYLGRSDFSVANRADFYKARINHDVRTGIADCPRSLFIFDEVDKMPEGVFESLTSLIDYHSIVDGRDNTKAIFIFLSNTAGVYISDRLGKLIKNGTLREETKLSDFEQILEKAAYNLDGGFKKTSLIEAHVIDHYLPFLPLEKEHVYKCLEVEFKRWNRRPDSDLIDSMIKTAVTYDRNHGLFATSGCKTLEKKVAVEVMSPLARK